jgi:hypothetical protein
MAAATVTEVVVSITVASVLFAIWLFSLFVLVLDDISVGAKVGWFILLTVLAPISVPVYLFLRHRRRSQRQAVTALDH